MIYPVPTPMLVIRPGGGSPPLTDAVLTEAGDFVLTEAGDFVLLES